MSEPVEDPITTAARTAGRDLRDAITAIETSLVRLHTLIEVMAAVSMDQLTARGTPYVVITARDIAIAITHLEDALLRLRDGTPR